MNSLVEMRNPFKRIDSRRVECIPDTFLDLEGGQLDKLYKLNCLQGVL
jgi:hypothetical protein